ncbi:MAG: 5-bromo-4-chloroindolyl phosphate hydrolysis family protein [Lachnospiraceae bacterium]|nr:5-bromo-4-chloroindolyl phosphate hydrolysis family protein [Lachnospiraceae bacterium]
MENGEQRNLGEEISSIVQNAVGSMDFQGLSHEIQSTAEQAIENVRRNMNINQQEMEQSYQGYAKKEKNYRIIRNARGMYEKVSLDTAERLEEAARRQDLQRQNAGSRQLQPQNRGQLANQQMKKTVHLIDNKPAGRISSVVYSLLGGIFGFSFGVAIFVLLIVGFSLWVPPCLWTALGLAPLFIGSAAMLGTGISQSKRLQRFRRYVTVLNGRTYAMLDEFASAVGKSNAYVRRDVQKMISLRMFPHGRLDNEGTCLILNNETWQQYIALKNQARQRELDAQEQKRIEQEDPFQREVNQMLKEGEDYLVQIKAANDAIPGEEISRKLDELELIIRKIFEQLKNHPEKIPEMNKFMEYYLPTTIKLVKAYQEFDGQAVAGDNINNGKKEIEKTIDTINKAFLNLFDSLFADTAMDISTDISVLQTMLAQEGLTDSDFNMNRE